jgi:hypothetical protein
MNFYFDRAHPRYVMHPVAIRRDLQLCSLKGHTAEAVVLAHRYRYPFIA